MTVFARLEVTPVGTEKLSPEIAKAVAALEQFDVSYETTPMATVLAGDSVDEVFAAVQAAHKAVSTDRVLTAVEIDDCHGQTESLADRVESIETELGRPPTNASP